MLCTTQPALQRLWVCVWVWCGCGCEWRCRCVYRWGWHMLLQFNVKTVFPCIGNSRCKDKTVVRQSYLYNGDSCTSKIDISILRLSRRRDVSIAGKKKRFRWIHRSIAIIVKTFTWKEGTQRKHWMTFRALSQTKRQFIKTFAFQKHRWFFFQWKLKFVES